MATDFLEIKKEDVPILESILEVIAIQKPVLSDDEILAMGVLEYDLGRYKKILPGIGAAEIDRNSGYISRICPDVTLKFYEQGKIGYLYGEQERCKLEEARRKELENEDLHIKRQGLSINRQALIWAAIGVIATIIIFLLSKLCPA